MKSIVNRIISVFLVLVMLMSLLATESIAMALEGKSNAYTLGEFAVSDANVLKRRASANTKAQSAEITLLVGDSTDLFVNVKDSEGNEVTNAPLKWAVSPAGVLSLTTRSGDTRYATITALSSKNSPATVTATLNSSTKTVVVEVLEKDVAAPDGTTIKLNEAKYDWFSGADYTLAGEVYSPNGTSGITLSWSVTDQTGVKIKTPASTVPKDNNHLAFSTTATTNADGWYLVTVKTSNGASSTRRIIVTESGTLPEPVKIGDTGSATIKIFKALSRKEIDTAFTERKEWHDSLDGVAVEYKDKDKNEKSDIANGSYTIALENTKYGVTLKKTGYQDYFIPSEVFNAFQYSKAAAELDVYLNLDKKDGKPYVSSVYGRESRYDNVYLDLSREKLTIVETKEYDLILSAGNTSGKQITYAIGQDVMHRISSTKSGKFFSEKLYGKLSDITTKKVYAYIFADSYDAREIKIEKKLTTEEDTLTKQLKNGKLNKDGIKFTVSGTGFIDGMEFSIDAFKDLPIGFEVEGNRVRVSLGFDFFSYTHETKGSSTTGTKWKDDWEWNSLKDDIKDLKKSILKDQSKKEEAYEKAKNIQQTYGKKVSKAKTKKHGWEVSFLGYYEFDFVNGAVKPVDWALTVTGKYELTYTQNGFVWVIPEYTYFAFSAPLAITVGQIRTVPDYNVPMEFTFKVDLSPQVKAGGGIGWKDICSAGLWGKATLAMVIEPTDNWHTTGDLSGEIGYEASFLYIFGTSHKVFEGSKRLWNGYLGSSKKSASIAKGQSLNDDADDKQSSMETALYPTDRDYLQSASPWFGESSHSGVRKKTNSKAMSAGGVEFKTLQTGVFEYSQSQIVSVGNKIVMVYVEDDSSRDEFNRMRLMSSVYNPSSKTWSRPIAVYDDGHNDVYPSLASDGNKVYVAWQKINTTLTEENSKTAETIIKNSEIYLSEFDSVANKFVNAKRITNNQKYDYMPKVAVNNGDPIVHYATCTNNDMTQVRNNTISRYVNAATTVQASSLNYIQTIAVSSDGSQVAYLMDQDGIISDSSDINAYVLGASTQEISIEKAIGDIVYAKIDGDETLFFTDQAKIYYYSEGEIQSVSVGLSDIAGGIYPVNRSNTLDFIWSVMNEDGSNSLWGMSYENGKWSESVCLTEQSEKLSSISVTALEDKMYGITSATEVTYSEDAGITKGETSLESFEFTDFTDLQILDVVALEEDIAAGQEGTISAFVKNNGTVDVDSITFIVEDGLGTSFSQTVNVELGSGEGENVSLVYPAPTNYSKTQLTVTAITSDTDTTPEDNSFSIEIGHSDLYFASINANEYDQGFLIDTKIYNASDIPSTCTAVLVKYDSKENTVAASYAGAGLEKNQSLTFGIPVRYEDLTFDEDNCAFVYLYIGNDDEDSAVPVLLVKTNDVSCSHLRTTQTEISAPTCTEKGISEISCSACGKPMGTVEQDALGHSFTNYVYNNDATTEVDGTETAKCDRCETTDTRTAVGTRILVNIQSISVKTLPNKTTYYVGESLNTAGLVIKATYSDGSSRDITSGYSCSGFSSTTAGTKTVTVTYEGKTTILTVQVLPITLTSIHIKTTPTKTIYNVGDSFNQSGLTLTATYSDGSTKTITSGFACSGFDSSSTGTKTITVAYEGKTTTFTVEVRNKPAPDPIIKIHNYTASKTVDYRTTITFSADPVQNPVDGATIHWFIDGQDKGASDTYTEKEAKVTYTVQAKYMKGNTVLAESETETVTVKTGFFARLKAFFRALFGRLPKVVQEYLGVEIIDRVLP